MQTIVVSSLFEREGKTTLAINLLAAYLRQERSAHLMDHGRNSDATAWLVKGGLSNSIVSPGLTQYSSAHPHRSPLLIIDLEREQNDAPDILAHADIALLVVRSRTHRSDFTALNAWDLELADKRGRGFDIIVPSQFDPREWQQNVRFLDELANIAGMERIANPIVH